MKLSFKYLRKISKALKHPYAVCAGMAVGIFWNFIPSLGVGVFLSAITAKLLKASSITAISTNLGTALFIPLFYTLNYLTGRMVMGKNLSNTEIQTELGHSMEQSLKNVETVIEQPVSFFSWFQIKSVSEDFIVGAAINAITAALIVFTVIWVVLKAIRWNKFLKKELPRKSLP